MIWHRIQDAVGVTCFPRDNSTLESLPVRLPPAHTELLKSTDGLIAADVRVFGTNDAVRNQLWWNSPDCWRFAWRKNGDGYWFFAEAAGGAQYAYELDANGQAGERVVYFSPITMTPAWYFPNFETFIENAVIRNATGPLKSEFEKAIKKFGTVPPSKHISWIPHPCMGGDMETGDVMLLEARTAMIMNADLWWAVNELKAEETASQMETYQDEKGRMRFRLLVDRSFSPSGAD